MLKSEFPAHFSHNPNWVKSTHNYVKHSQKAFSENLAYTFNFINKQTFWANLF